jgi:hypothetical protein
LTESKKGNTKEEKSEKLFHGFCFSKRKTKITTPSDDSAETLTLFERISRNP